MNDADAVDSLRRISRYVSVFLVGALVGALLVGGIFLVGGRAPWSECVQIITYFGGAVVVIEAITSGDVVYWVTGRKIGRRAVSEPRPAPDQVAIMAQFRREVGRPFIKGVAVGGILTASAMYLGVLPVMNWTNATLQVFLGMLFGAYLSTRPLLLKFGPIDGLSADSIVHTATLGVLTGGALGFCAMAVWNAVVAGSYDPMDNMRMAYAGAVVVAPANVWRMWARRGKHPRLRFMIGAALAALIGAAVVWGSLLLAALYAEPVLLAVVRWMPAGLRSDAYLFQRAFAAIGALIGIALYSLWWFGIRPKSAIAGALNAAGQVSGELATETPKLVLYVKGFCWLTVGALLWRAAYVFFGLSIFEFEGGLWEIAEWCIVVGGFLAIAHGLEQVRTALRRPATPRTQGVHGTADTATERQAEEAERGGARSPLHDQRF
jgi:hypothetical protein